MKKITFLMLLALSLPVFSQSLNEIYGTNPRIGKGACSANSVQEMDGVLMTLRMKKNYDWIIANCKSYKSVVESKFPNHIEKEVKLDLALYSYLKDCYSDKEIDIIMLMSIPLDDVKSCNYESNNAAVRGVMNLLGNY